MKDKKWIYYNPTFESEQYNPMVLIYSPWAGHKRFAYDYVRFMEPETVVELGSYYGCSAFAMLQAIKDSGIKSRFFAIDTWAGDDFTKNDYKEDIYGQYKRINDECFSGVTSVMIRHTFDEACPVFKENSIDLLHIDGSHAYDDVKHDYLTWKDKVKDNGVIFFHDVGKDLLFGEKMGSHIFWEELKKECPYILEMPFSNGLGILFKSEAEYLLVKNAMSVDVYQGYINLQDTINKDEIRKSYFTIRDLEKYNTDLKTQIEIINGHLENYKNDTEAKQNYILHLEEDVKELQDKCSNSVEKAEFEKLNGQFKTLQAYAESKVSYAGELEAQMEGLKTYANDKDRYASELELQMSELRSYVTDKETYSIELEKQMSELKNYSDGKENYSKELEKQLGELKAYAEGKANYVQELEKQIKELGEFASGKDKYASELEKRVSELNDCLNERQSSFEILQKYASDTEINLNAEIGKLVSELEWLKSEHSALYEEKSKVDSRLELLKEKLKRLPFGNRLLKDIE